MVANRTEDLATAAAIGVLAVFVATMGRGLS